MTKPECIAFLEKTRKSYTTHMLGIKYLVGKDFADKNPVLLNKEKSLLGRWIYEDTLRTKNITGTIFYDELESLHSSWCEELNNISYIYMNNSKKSFLFKKKIDVMGKDKVNAHFDNVQETTERLNKIINKVQTRVYALPESKFL